MTENTNIPREIYIRSNKQDFIGKKLEFQKIQGDTCIKLINLV